MDIKVGDYVTRVSHKHDMIFRVISIEEDTCYLKGANVRLYADSEIDDLVKVDFKESDDKEVVDRLKDTTNNLDRDDYFYLPGKILHIDTEFQLNNTLANPYKIRKKSIFENGKIN